MSKYGVFFRSVFGHFSHSINLKHIEKFRAKLFSSQSTIGSIHRRSSVKKVLLKISQNLQKSTCTRISFLVKLLAEACNFLKKKTLPQVISCELCEFFKSNIFLCKSSGGCFCATPRVIK